MATVYCDPTAQFDGDGTAPTQASAPGGVGAFNTWVGHMTASNTHSTKGGTIYTGAQLAPPSGSAGNPTIFNSYGTGKAQFAPPVGDACFFLSNKDYITFQNLYLNLMATGGNGKGVNTGAAGISNITIDSCDYSGPFATGNLFSISGGSTRAVTDLTVTNNRAVGEARFLLVFLYAVSGLSHARWNISNNTVIGTADWTGDVTGRIYGGVQIAPTVAAGTSTLSNVTFRNNVFKYLSGNSISADGSYIDTSAVAPNANIGFDWLITGNTIVNCGARGTPPAYTDTTQGSLNISGCGRVEISNNYINSVWCRGAAIQGQQRRGGTVIRDNVIIEPKTSIGNDGVGILIDRFDDNVLVLRNRISDAYGALYTNDQNSGEGIGTWMSTNVTFIGNLIERCKYGFSSGANSTWASSNVYYINNTFRDLRTALFRTGMVGGSGMTAATVTAYNNIFMNAPLGTVQATGAVPSFTNWNYNALVDVTNPYNVQSAGGNDQVLTWDTALLNSNLYPTTSSPLYNTGIFNGYFRDNTGLQFRNNPSFGALQPFTRGVR
jgi:hypothetical protein